MKKLSFLALAAAGLMLGACSEKDEVGAVSTPNSTEGEGSSYIAIGINLPTVPITRGTENDAQATLTDGLPVEYAVNDALIALFKSDGTFKAAYDLNPEPWTMQSGDKQVTESSKKIVKKIDGGGVQVGDQALVILNKNNLVKINGTELQVNVGGTYTNVTKFSDLNGGSFNVTESAIKDATSHYAPTMTANGFFMANAPLSDVAGSTSSADLSSAKVRVLVPINAVFATEAEAQAATPSQISQIYVERGMAKVTMQAKSDVAFTGTGMTSYTWSITGWTLDNTNTTSYVVRSTAGHDDFKNLKSQMTGGIARYAGNTDITTGSPAEFKYRTYFAQDPNYSTPATLLRWNGTGTNGEFVNKYGDENPQYCYENTFDVDNQNENQTTLAQIKITASTSGADLYLIGGVKSTVYTSATLIGKIQEVTYNLLEAWGIKGSLGTSDIAVTLPTTSVAGIMTFGDDDAKIKVVPNTSKYNVSDLPTEFYTLLSKAVGSIDCYKGGESYYTVRIKHFGDAQTPWNTWEKSQTDDEKLINPVPVVGSIYPVGTSDNKNNNYLGRYGVLRNNWYDIDVSSIRYLGSSTPKDPTTTTDDELDAYIAVQINVLSWAKRTQTWSF